MIRSLWLEVMSFNYRIESDLNSKILFNYILTLIKDPFPMVTTIGSLNIPNFLPIMKYTEIILNTIRLQGGWFKKLWILILERLLGKSHSLLCGWWWHFFLANGHQLSLRGWYYFICSYSFFLIGKSIFLIIPI